MRQPTRYGPTENLKYPTWKLLEPKILSTSLNNSKRSSIKSEENDYCGISRSLVQLPTFRPSKQKNHRNSQRDIYWKNPKHEKSCPENFCDLTHLIPLLYPNPEETTMPSNHSKIKIQKRKGESMQRHEEDEQQFEDRQRQPIRLRDSSKPWAPARCDTNYIDGHEPDTFEEANSGSDAEKRRLTIKEELKAHQENQTSILIPENNQKRRLTPSGFLKSKHRRLRTHLNIKLIWLLETLLNVPDWTTRKIPLQ